MKLWTEGMSSGFVLKLLKEVGKMLKTWRTHFLPGMTMLGTRESTGKYDIYCHDVSTPMN